MRQEELLAYIDRQEEAKLRVSWQLYLLNKVKALTCIRFFIFLFPSLSVFYSEKEVLLVRFVNGKEILQRMSKSTVVLKEC